MKDIAAGLNLHLAANKPTSKKNILKQASQKPSNGISGFVTRLTRFTIPASVNQRIGQRRRSDFTPGVNIIHLVARQKTKEFRNKKRQKTKEFESRLISPHIAMGIPFLRDF